MRVTIALYSIMRQTIKDRKGAQTFIRTLLAINVVICLIGFKKSQLVFLALLKLIFNNN